MPRDAGTVAAGATDRLADAVFTQFFQSIYQNRKDPRSPYGLSVYKIPALPAGRGRGGAPRAPPRSAVRAACSHSRQCHFVHL